MSYYVETAPAVLNYIASIPGLTDEGRASVVEGYTSELGRDADRFLDLYPLGHESLHFRYEFPHLEVGTLHTFDFIVDGSGMEMGVVRVVYVEHRERALPS
jgi:hypothetical protein